MKYGRCYPHPTEEVKSHRDRATFCGNTDRNWLSNDLNSVLPPLYQMLPLMNHIFCIYRCVGESF